MRRDRKWVVHSPIFQKVCVYYTYKVILYSFKLLQIVHPTTTRLFVPLYCVDPRFSSPCARLYFEDYSNRSTTIPNTSVHEIGLHISNFTQNLDFRIFDRTIPRFRRLRPRSYLEKTSLSFAHDFKQPETLLPIDFTRFRVFPPFWPDCSIFDYLMVSAPRFCTRN